MHSCLPSWHLWGFWLQSVSSTEVLSREHGFELVLSEFAVQQNHHWYFLKIIEPSISKNQNHMGWVQGHHLEKVTPFSGSEVAAAAAKALRVFVCSPVYANMHCLFSGIRGTNPSCSSSLYVASSNSERSVFPTVVDFEKLSLEIEAMELRRLL